MAVTPGRIDSPDPYLVGRTDGDLAARKSIVMHIRKRLASFTGEASLSLAIRGELAELAAEVERRDDDITR